MLKNGANIFANDAEGQTCIDVLLKQDQIRDPDVLSVLERRLTEYKHNKDYDKILHKFENRIYEIQTRQCRPTLKLLPGSENAVNYFAISLFFGGFIILACFTACLFYRRIFKIKSKSDNNQSVTANNKDNHLILDTGANKTMESTREKEVKPAAIKLTAEQKVRNKAICNMLLKLLIPQLELIKGTLTKNPICFICYAWGNSKQEKFIQKQLAVHLAAVGVNVQLDMWHNKTGSWISGHTQKIATADTVIVACSEKMLEKYSNTQSGAVVSLELEQVFAKLKKEKHKGSIVPILLDGTEDTAIPLFIRGLVYTGFSNPAQYTLKLLELLEAIYTPQLGANPFQKIYVEHKELVDQILKGKMEVDLAPFIEQEQQLMLQRKEEKQKNIKSKLGAIYQLPGSNSNQSDKKEKLEESRQNFTTG